MAQRWAHAVGGGGKRPTVSGKIAVGHLAMEFIQFSKVCGVGGQIFAPYVHHQGRVGTQFGVWDQGGGFRRGLWGGNLCVRGGPKGCCIRLVDCLLTVKG